MTESTNPPPPAAQAFRQARQLLPTPQAYQGNPVVAQLANLEVHTHVRFFLDGQVCEGLVAAVRVNTRRRRGIAHVSYQVSTGAGIVLVPATNIISHEDSKR